VVPSGGSSTAPPMRSLQIGENIERPFSVPRGSLSANTSVCTETRLLTIIVANAMILIDFIKAH
jgi:hypothetical protein